MLRSCLLVLILSSSLFAADKDDTATEQARPRGTRLFFRALGSESNAPILPKSRSAWTQDSQTQTGTTGMSDLGFTEYPFCFGTMDFTFVQGHAYYPKLISGALANEAITNTADLLMDYVYEPDGCVWGRTGRRFVQTFTATKSELVSITLLIASEPGEFRATLLEGGAGGKAIGPAKTFTSGHSMTWGTATWQAGQAPLTPGRTYGIAIQRHDGKPFSPYLHATGNCYDGGLLHVDHRAFPESELAAWIVEQPDELVRAITPDADSEGWVYKQSRIALVPRSKNIRLISLTISPITKEELAQGPCDIVMRVWSEDGKLIARPKRCLTASEGTAHALFSERELPVTAGERLYVDAFLVPHKKEGLPASKEIKIAARDMRLVAYGETQPGAMPSIFNLTIEPETDSRLKFKWSTPVGAKTVIHSEGPGVNGGQTFEVPPVEREIVIGKFWAGHEYDLRLTATDSFSGQVWRTPVYRVRMPRLDEKFPVPVNPYPEGFVRLAPPRRSKAPSYPPLRYLKQVPVVNHEFEEGLAGWHTSDDGVIGALPEAKWGKQMAGFTHQAGEQREQVFITSNLAQTIETIPGHTYVLSAWGHTSVKNGPDGDTRVRLFADPTGGDTFDGNHASQWYWTGGKWMRFEHTFRAEGQRATIGLGLFRWRDLDSASAHVDQVTVFDLGPSPGEADEPAKHLGRAARLALVEPKLEVEDKIEAHAVAPPGYVITGIGARAHYDNITTLWLRVQPLMPDGTLGAAEEIRTGWEPDAGLEAKIELPEGYVATGFGAGIAPEWDVKRLRVWAKPLKPDGTLGEEKEFRGGKDLESGVEREVHATGDRVLTSAGLNCSNNDANGIKAISARLIVTATGETRSK